MFRPTERGARLLYLSFSILDRTICGNFHVNNSVKHYEGLQRETEYVLLDKIGMNSTRNFAACI